MNDDARSRLLTLLADPRLASDVPGDEAPRLLAEVAALQGNLGSVQAVLLVKILAAPNTGGTTAAGADENLSADEAARRLGVSKDFLYKAARARRLPFAVRIGRRVVFSAHGLERWDRQHRVGG